MPFRRFKRRKAFIRRKKPFRRFRRRGFRGKRNASTLVLKHPTTLPDRLFLKLKCVETFNYTFADGSVTAANVTIQANNPGDPWGSAGSTQMYGYDQWSGLYQLCRVHGAKVSYQVIAQSNDAGTGITSGAWGFWHCVAADTKSTFTGSRDLAGQYPYAKYKIANTYQMGSQVGKMAMTTRKIYGTTKQAVKSEDNWVHTLGTTVSPTNPWYFHVAVAPFNGVTGTEDQDVNVIIKLTMYCELYKRTELAIS